MFVQYFVCDSIQTCDLKILDAGSAGTISEKFRMKTYKNSLFSLAAYSILDYIIHARFWLVMVFIGLII